VIYFYPNAMQGSLRFENITKTFGSFTAVHDLNLTIKAGTTFSLLGPSGCGKTTLLRIAAGFERPNHGRVYLDECDITDLPPEKRPLNTVFQHYALFPHLSVRENIAFGLKMAKHSNEYIRNKVDRMLDLVDLCAHADHKPSQLSGGQKQRVGIARALANQPKVLLLDEPLAALDLKLRQRLLVELDAIHKEVGITFIYVTHDQNEAMSISDFIAVMNHGKLEQIGQPTEIYEAPRSSFVASFIGNTNFINGTISQTESSGLAKAIVPNLGTIHLLNRLELSLNSPFHLSLRPEQITLSSTQQPLPSTPTNQFQGTIETITYYGSHSQIYLRCGQTLFNVHHSQPLALMETPRFRSGDRVWFQWSATNGFMLEHFEK
jgi:spermidine/putrescine transport system ATP-binding protein